MAEAMNAECSFPQSGKHWRDMLMSRQHDRNDHSERRKFSTSCCWLVERLLSKMDST